MKKHGAAPLVWVPTMRDDRGIYFHPLDLCAKFSSLDSAELLERQHLPHVRAANEQGNEKSRDMRGFP